jgi:cyclopropane fatty-acyl-phospholipid synthase-like methyltransferase
MVVCLLAVSLAIQASAEGQERRFKEESRYTNMLYVPIADEVIDRMFELAKVTKDDVVYHLICGDGRVLYRAASRYGAHGVGIDLNPTRIEEAMGLARKYEVGTLVEIRHGDSLKVKDIGEATVVVLYHLPEFMDLWFPIAKEKLKPGTRILSHDYRWTKGWEPVRVETLRSRIRDNHKVYLWVVPEKERK